MKLVVDTSTIIHLLATAGAVQERKHARQHVTKVIAESGTIIVPTAVIAELHYNGLAGSKYLEQFGTLASGSLRVVSLNQTAADIAGSMRADALKRHRDEKKDVRGAILYDALIAATAVQQKAAVVLTANSRDYRALFKVVGAAIEIRDSRQAPTGQAELFEGEGGRPKARKPTQPKPK